MPVKITKGVLLHGKRSFFCNDCNFIGPLEAYDIREMKSFNPKMPLGLEAVVED